MLDGAGLPVGELHFDLGPLFIFGPFLGSRLARRDGRGWIPLWLRFRLHRLAVPLRIVKVVVRLHEIVNRKVVLSIIEPGAAPDNLLELDHRIDRAHQDDVADVPCIHAGGEFLRSIVLGLRHPFGQRFVPPFGFDDGELGVAIFQHIIGGQRFAAPPIAFNATERNWILPPDAAPLDDSPARRFQRGINVFCAGFGFVHHACLFVFRKNVGVLFVNIRLAVFLIFIFG